MGYSVDGLHDDPVRPNTPVISRLENQDRSLFSRASHDRTPRHLNPGYARVTPYGHPLAFGILAVLAALTDAPPPRDKVLSHVAIDIRQSVFPGVDYHRLRTGADPQQPGFLEVC